MPPLKMKRSPNDNFNWANADKYHSLPDLSVWFSSENVSKIELVTNPSAEFDAEGNCGVINIILKSKPVGFDGNVHTVLTQRSHFGAEEGIGLSFSSGNFSVEYNNK